MTSPNNFDQAYFEDGVRSKVSAYENYRWMPERSIREATSIINNIEFETSLDYGCAKGFLVHAMRLLGKHSYGVDISKYAIDNCYPAVRPYVNQINSIDDVNDEFDLIIAKDVLEHVPHKEIPRLLAGFRERCKNIFIAVPLGDGDRFRIREYEMDSTHIIRESEEWWLTTIVQAGFKIKFFDYKYHYVKDKWTETHPFGNAFIVGE
jgi:2-polyprenyl-3-methyl-5-hydroxy-6-metoxy-1,4-benzoquinol methylase